MVLAASRNDVMIKKFSTALEFDGVRKSIANGTAQLQCISGCDDFSDFFTKTVDNTKLFSYTKRLIVPSTKVYNS